MEKKTIDDVNLKDKKVIVRVDFNVPLNAEGVITDDTRIQAALPTIKKILGEGAALILMSHLGRPKGEAKPELSLKVAADYLSKLLGQDITMAPDCIGAEVKALAADLKAGEILMLENTRYHAAEDTKKEELKEAQQEMAKELASLADVYVNDAFGTAHRAHASTAIIADYIDTAVAGYLMDKEIKYLGNTIANPAKPFVAIIGGAKVSGKLQVLKSLMGTCDTIIIGGGMAFTFKKAMGQQIGDSLCEDDLVQTAIETLEAAKEAGTKILIPVDSVAADKFGADANTQVTHGDIKEGWMGLDIGPESTETFCKELATAKTILWNGPMGCFEMEPFSHGTFAVCKAVAVADATSIIGGGDSVAAVNQSGMADQMSHISTGGGASLEYLEGKVLPGIACLNDK
ncbi:phosphoglycerate kinase [bacterium M21]|nr:phosphoglycerate kinase [bacterium M21]